MSSDQDSSFFDLGDKTALVCIDHPQYQKMIVPQLIDLNYKVHLGLFAEDVLLKLSTYSYNVVVIYENFNGSNLENNPIVSEIVRRPGTLHRSTPRFRNITTLLSRPRRKTRNYERSSYVRLRRILPGATRFTKLNK